MKYLNYGLLSFPAAISLLLMQVYIPPHIAEQGALSITMIGLVFFAARLVDTVSDPLIGYLSDRTPLQKGKRRVWILIAVPLFLIVFYMIILLPKTEIYLFLVASLWYILGTAIVIPYYTWGSELSSNYNDYTKWTSTRVVFGLMGSITALILPTLFLDSPSTGEILDFTFIFIVASFAIAILMLLKVPDHGVVKNESFSLLSAFSIFKKGSLFNKLIFSQFFNGIANALPATLFVFFVTYVLKRSDLVGPLLVLYFLCAVVSAPLWIKVSQKWSKEGVWKFAMILAAIVFFGVLAVDENAIILFIAITIFTGFMAGADLCLPAAMLADLIDVDEYETGNRRPGIYFAIWGTVSKLTLAFAIGISFSTLGLDMFEPNSQGALVDVTILTLLYALLPAALKLIATMIMLGYRLSSHDHQKIISELEK
jgi:Na+/melibiose symporter-like transporter